MRQQLCGDVGSEHHSSALSRSRGALRCPQAAVRWRSPSLLLPWSHESPPKSLSRGFDSPGGGPSEPKSFSLPVKPGTLVLSCQLQACWTLRARL